MTDIIFKKIDEILMNPKTATGDVLAFVTTEAETGKIYKMIEKNLSKYPNDDKPYYWDEENVQWVIDQEYLNFINTTANTAT